MKSGAPARPSARSAICRSRRTRPSSAPAPSPTPPAFTRRRAEEPRKLRDHDPGIYRPEPGATEPDFPLRPRGGETPDGRDGLPESDYNTDHLYDAFLKLADKKASLRLRSGSAGLYQQAAGRARAFPPGLLQRPIRIQRYRHRLDQTGLRG